MKRGTVVMLAATLAFLAYVSTGWVVVPPGEVVVVRRLGRVLSPPWLPGPHLGWPLGFDQTTRVRTDAVRRVEFGLAGTAGSGDEPGAGEYLTGDLNLFRARGIVQYRVSDPAAFALRSADRDSLLIRLSEASLTRALSRQRIDSALRAGRAEIAMDVAAALSRAVDRYGLGIAILGVNLTDARPPTEVAADFLAAQAAETERDRRINEARTYEASTLPVARASALAKLEHAHAVADRTVALANARAGRFLALLAEAQRARALTVRRVYLDTLRDLLPRVKRKLLMTPEEPVDLSILGTEK